MNAMNDISATETAIVYGLEPVWGAAFAWFLLGERWGSTEWIGASLVLCKYSTSRCWRDLYVEPYAGRKLENFKAISS